nr:uncharacterized protein LOC113827897 [Penaeus vannamei]
MKRVLHLPSSLRASVGGDLKTEVENLVQSNTTFALIHKDTHLKFISENDRFRILCVIQDSGHARLLPALTLLPSYPEPQVPPAGASVAEDREDRTDIDWKTMPRPLPEPRWPELDHNMATVPLWPSDPACAMHNVSFALRASKTFLVSFPRSGNSWTRYLVEGATGVATGAVYAGENLIHFGKRPRVVAWWFSIERLGVNIDTVPLRWGRCNQKKIKTFLRPKPVAFEDLEPLIAKYTLPHNVLYY